jgi:hypothetical protein
MKRPDAKSPRRRGKSGTLAVAVLTGAAMVFFALPATLARADPAPPPPLPGAPAPAPPAGMPAPPPPADPNAPPADPDAPPPPPAWEPGRVADAPGGLSYVVPAGWKVVDASKLTYGSALLNKDAAPAGPVPAATDTSILLGKLDLKLFAGAEPDNTKAAVRLASDMGEFFMPFPGTRTNEAVVPLNAAGVPGAASYYDVKFNDATKPDGQIWAAVVGTPAGATTVGTPGAQVNRWFVVWLGNAKFPVDQGAAVALAQSIQPFTPPPPPPPPAPPAPDPNAPPPDPNAPVPPPPPPGKVPVGVPIPVAPVPGMTPDG